MPQFHPKLAPSHLSNQLAVVSGSKPSGEVRIKVGIHFETLERGASCGYREWKTSGSMLLFLFACPLRSVHSWLQVGQLNGFDLHNMEEVVCGFQILAPERLYRFSLGNTTQKVCFISKTVRYSTHQRWVFTDGVRCTAHQCQLPVEGWRHQRPSVHV